MNEFFYLLLYYQTPKLNKMKKFTFLLLLFTASILLSCNTENLEDNTLTNEVPSFSVTESTINFQLRSTPCMEVPLIAGQNMTAGSVSVDRDGDNLIITYSTIGDWTIDLTHLSAGNCDDQWVPTTGSGNPKVGKFEHTEPHSVETNTVVYIINNFFNDPDNTIAGLFCFAAHAEVTGPTGGETAWAEGIEFDGNSWAMYVEATETPCTNTTPSK